MKRRRWRWVGGKIEITLRASFRTRNTLIRNKLTNKDEEGKKTIFISKFPFAHIIIKHSLTPTQRHKQTTIAMQFSQSVTHSLRDPDSFLGSHFLHLLYTFRYYFEYTKAEKDPLFISKQRIYPLFHFSKIHILEIYVKLLYIKYYIFSNILFYF